MRLTFWTALVVLLIDQASKALVMGALNRRPDDVIDIASPLLRFVYAENRGINFGLFGGMDMRWILVAVALGISAFVIWMVWRDGQKTAGLIAAGLLVGGAMGNVIDRVTHGFVFDFINMSCCGLANPYAFNLADVAIFAGALGLVFWGSDGNGKPKTGKRKIGNSAG